jgi:hypothetical protein
VVEHLERRIFNIVFVFKIFSLYFLAVGAKDLTIDPNVLHCHLVLGERAGFVGADARSGPQGLDCF